MKIILMFLLFGASVCFAKSLKCTVVANKERIFESIVEFDKETHSSGSARIDKKSVGGWDLDFYAIAFPSSSEDGNHTVFINFSKDGNLETNSISPSVEGPNEVSMLIMYRDITKPLRSLHAHCLVIE